MGTINKPGRAKAQKCCSKFCRKSKEARVSTKKKRPRSKFTNLINTRLVSDITEEASVWVPLKKKKKVCQEVSQKEKMSFVL